MSRRPKGNDASRYRALLRDLRSRKGLMQAKSALKSIEDPYFRAQAYLAMAVHGTKTKTEKKPLIDKMLEESTRAEPLWRRGELFSYILRDSADLTEGFPGIIHGNIIEQLKKFEKGQGLSEALVKIAKSNPCSMVMDTLDIALGNEAEFAYKDAKVLIKNWARRCSKGGPSPDDIMGKVLELKNIHERAELLGYLHLQIYKNQPKADISHIFASSISTSMELEGQKRTAMMSYLSKHAYTNEALEMLVETIDKFEQVSERIKVTTYISSGADRGGNTDLANTLMDRAINEMSSIKDDKVKNGIKLGIAQDLIRLDRRDQAEKLLGELIDELPENDPIVSMATNILDGKKKEIKEPTPVVEFKKDGSKDNHLLALYDTYEGSIKKVHLKAIARAAPLCYSYDLDLALIGFPETDLFRLVEKSKKETNVGQGGKYISMLAGEGRIKLIKTVGEEPPKDWSDIGLPVATTSKPDPSKKMPMAGAVKLASRNHPKKVICLIMGLGRSGLPRSLLNSVDLHLELTGKNISLETATAMGIMVQQLHDATEW